MQNVPAGAVAADRIAFRFYWIVALDVLQTGGAWRLADSKRSWREDNDAHRRDNETEEFKLSKFFGDIVDHKKPNEFSMSHENVAHS